MSTFATIQRCRLFVNSFLQKCVEYFPTRCYNEITTKEEVLLWMSAIELNNEELN